MYQRVHVSQNYGIREDADEAVIVTAADRQEMEDPDNAEPMRIIGELADVMSLDLINELLDAEIIEALIMLKQFMKVKNETS